MSFTRSLKEKSGKVWEDGYNHPFVQEIGKGTLDRKKFQFYLLQDYQYLIQYAKVFALGTLKAESEELMMRLTQMQHGTLAEMDLHRAYMKQFGILPEATQNVSASLFNRAYTANMLAVGQAGGVAEIIAAVFPCAWTYADYGKRLKQDYADVLADNFYSSWIESYASEAFSDSFEWMYDALDELCRNMTDRELRRIEEIFISSVEFEYLFWDMSYKMQMSY